MLQEKLVKALEDKEQLNQRVKLLETRVKRYTESHDVNAAMGRDHTDKVILYSIIYGKQVKM